MLINNWKKNSDFIPLLDSLAGSEEDVIVVIGKYVLIGWFHVRIIRNMYPDRKIIFISRDERARKILKQEGYKVSQSIQDIDRLLPE